MYMVLSIQISSIADQTLQRSFKVNFHSRQSFGLVGCLISWLEIVLICLFLCLTLLQCFEPAC